MIIKVCGLVDQKNIEALNPVDIDWIGYNFYQESSRYIGIGQRPITTKETVGVFVNATEKFISESVEAYALSYIQLHGDETPTFVEKINSQYNVIKAVGAETELDIILALEYDERCDYLLFDKKSRNYGGSGKKFDWKILNKYSGNTPFLVAGGIGIEDIYTIKEMNHPKFIGIDINSKFEISPGIKDIRMIKDFVREIRN